MKRPNPSPHRQRAFSLVEVTLALGLVSFILVALLALFGVGMQASRESANDTMLSQITAQTLALVQSKNLPPIDGAAQPYFFTVQGERQLINAANAETFYTANVRAESTTAAGDASTYLILLKIDITWPSGKTSIVSSMVKP